MIDKYKEALLNAKIKKLNGYDKECNNTIAEYLPTYNSYKNLPKTIFIILVVLGAIVGIILGAVFEKFWIFLVIAGGAFLVGLALFFLLSIQCSERILNLEYTRKLYYAVKIKTYEDELSKLNQENK